VENVVNASIIFDHIWSGYDLDLRPHFPGSRRTTNNTCK